MSWHGGSEIMASLIETCLENIPQENIRRKLYADVLPSFAEQDWNDFGTLFGNDPAYDKAVRDVYPNIYEPIGSPYTKSDDFDDDEEF